MRIISMLLQALNRLASDGPKEIKPEERELIHASDTGDIGRVKELLEKGINPNTVAVNGDASALIQAVDSGHVELVKLLIKYGANVNYQGELDSALTCAVVISSKELVEILIDAGADPNLKGGYLVGATPLAYALKFANEDVIGILRAHGALE